MRIGILSDTHDEFARIQRAVTLLRDSGATSLIHCGDFIAGSILKVCSVLPLWFVFGNNDSDSVPDLQRAAAECGATCLGWGGTVELGGQRIAVTHGHMTTDVRRLLATQPDYLLSGHSHIPDDSFVGSVRRINPGALHRADEFTVALLDLDTAELQLLRVGDRISYEGD